MPLFQENLFTEISNETHAMIGLRFIARVDRDLGVAMTEFAWFADGNPSTEYGDREAIMVRNLRELATTNIELARAVWEWDRLAGGKIGPNEVSALNGIISLAEKNPELAVAAAGAPWAADSIADHEDGAFYSLNGLASRSPEFARQILAYGLEEPVRDSNVYLISSLSRMTEEQVERLIRQSWFADGLDLEERVFITALRGARLFDSLFDDMLDSWSIRTMTITLPLAGEVNLWLVDHDPLPPSQGDETLAAMEAAVRGAERFTRVPFPTNDVILLTHDPAYRFENRLGIHAGNYMRLQRGSDRPVSQSGVHYEVAHYYFNEGPRWFAEGGAESVKWYIQMNLAVEARPEFYRLIIDGLWGGDGRRAGLSRQKDPRGMPREGIRAHSGDSHARRLGHHL